MENPVLGKRFSPPSIAYARALSMEKFSNVTRLILLGRAEM